MLLEEPAKKPTEYQVSVRRLVEFVTRVGDLSSGGQMPTRLRAQEGLRAHRKLQKTRPPEYEPEVSLSYKTLSPEVQLEIAGRVDGVWKRPEGVLLEEIKSVTANWDYNADPLHWAQLKIYGWIYAIQNNLSEVELQLTYFQLENEQASVFREKHSTEALHQFATGVANEYLEWIIDLEHWLQRRNRSVTHLSFPYAAFRTGQRDLSRAVYKAVQQGRRLFAEAPTGTGKTISILFPTIKALPVKGAEKIFFLTARNTTQQLAEKALGDMIAGGLRLRWITLTAREKVCSNNGQPCDILQCPRAIGYYDRRKPAIRDALELQQITRDSLDSVARKHNVCPHELSLDVSEWVDVIICDYNYAFDPAAQLKRHFAESSARHILLVDEAHNLVDRAREMFSAQLSSREIAQCQREIASPSLKKSLAAVEREFTNLPGEGEAATVLNTPPKTFVRTLESLIEAAESFLAGMNGRPVPQELLGLYFNVLSFLRILDFLEENYRVIIEAQTEDRKIRLFCLDPSKQLAQHMEAAAAAIFFSATLTPLHHFRKALGGTETDQTIKLPSPFPPGNLRVLVAGHVQTSFRHRSKSVSEVCRMLAAFVGARPGNYLVYFPSYAYLNEVLPTLQDLVTDAEFVVQSSMMNDGARAEFLQKFSADNSSTTIGLAVMGGIFGEGIDLVGERLIGVAIVGIGLPQIGLERNLIRNHYDGQGLDGFDHAYLFPGLNRVLQAAGRLIRSETDRGALLLVDNRFTESRITALLPRWWDPRVCRSSKALREELERFWNLEV